MWINPNTLEVFNLHADIRSAFKNVSFPSEMTEQAIASVGLLPLISEPKPEVNYTKNVTEGTPILVDGNWKQVWVVTDASAQEIAQRTEDQASNVRSSRDQKLVESDWVVIKSMETDVPELDAWKSYRQALRNIPQQSGFPWNVNWPENP